MTTENKNSFLVPIGLGWIVNLIGWVLFISTFNHSLEILTGVFSLGCVYVGYKHKLINTKPFLDFENLSANNLIWASSVQAIWMFAWGFGFFGDFNF